MDIETQRSRLNTGSEGRRTVGPSSRGGKANRNFRSTTATIQPDRRAFNLEASIDVRDIAFGTYAFAPMKAHCNAKIT